MKCRVRFDASGLLNNTCMRYFKIANPFKKLRLMLREVDNYYFFMRQAEIFSDSGELKHYKLKMNDKHGIYGAINLPPELLLYHKGEELEQLEKTYFGNEMSKLNDVFIKYDIIELYKIDFERIKDDDYYAYVFNIRYKWNHCNPGTVVTAIVSALLVLAGIAVGVSVIV